jgi:hypothetical protein
VIRQTQGSSFLATLICAQHVFSSSHPEQDLLKRLVGAGGLLDLLFHGGERSEPEWNNKFADSPDAPALLDWVASFATLLFLPVQENETDASSQKRVGGVRELVRPLDGVESVRSPARAAHALCSKLEPLPERRLPPPARISKDESEHDQKYANQSPHCLCRNRRRQGHP